MKKIRVICPECGQRVTFVCWNREDFEELGLGKVWDEGLFEKHTMPEEPGSKAVPVPKKSL